MRRSEWSVKATPLDRLSRAFKRSPGDRADPMPVSAGLTPVGSHEYKGGFTAKAAEETGASAGEHNLHRKSVQGKKNARRARGRFPRMLVATFKTQVQIIGVDLRETIQGFREELAELNALIAYARQAAIDSIEAYAAEGRRLVVREHEIERQGLYLPHRVFLIILVVALVGLFGADFTMLPISFSPLNLSDSPWFGINGLDELHLAATGVLGGLIVLAHRAAAELRTILHERRIERYTPKDMRGALPDKDVDAAKLCAIWLTLGLFLLAGVTILRVTYLHTIGQSAQLPAFLLINLGIYGASFSASLWFAHPLVKEYRSSSRRARSAEKTMAKGLVGFQALVAQYNVRVERIGMTVATAAQHVRAAASDSGLKEETYELGVVYGQHEPTEEQLFESNPALPSVPGDALEQLMGTPVPAEYKMLDPGELDGLIVERRNELLGLRHKLERQPIDLIGAVNPYQLPDPDREVAPETDAAEPVEDEVAEPTPEQVAEEARRRAEAAVTESGAQTENGNGASS